MTESPWPSVADVRLALQAPRPGLDAMLHMATRPRPAHWVLPPDHRPRQGGVSILLYPAEGDLLLVLTRRTENVATHKGQISLPGGAREPGDQTLLDTALRETREELGIGTEDAVVLGSLTSVYIPPSDYCIQPYVVYLPLRPELRPDPFEVAETLEMPLRLLLDPATRREETRMLRGTRVVVPFYKLGAHKIWGATAMVLGEFEAVLTRARCGICQACES